ncbi:hypothetical protein CSB45_13660 [candidate division KSB3 bacterium]|uniref:Peptidoglycan binding-like domain-containing protein n=1 Tax=candidate division KSB3 bacterium TaxID=2044937 RepID=A0A2G6E1N8_9BACT|nr:MAG: hypothetical protein CSB45_13660 [candidate division KSB3 bacterium]PIE28606.1 MAG: hypothetical protein CSA57_13310 [candidate division KSB3 bacterium]
MMKSKLALLLDVMIALLLSVQGCSRVSEMVSPSSEVEQPLATCQPSSTQPTLAVMDFEFTAGKHSKSELAGGLSDMLINALVETQCFRVVERSRLQEILQEIGLGAGGTMDPSTAPSLGKLTGAQLLVMGTVTEFEEGESGSVGGGILGPIAAAVGIKTAHIGFTLRIVDATSGVIVTSKSVDKKVSKAGLIAGGSLFGLSGGGTLFKSKAMQDAMEQALIETVAIIANQRERFAAVTQAPPGEGDSQVDCSQLAAPMGPRFMVVIPEVHISRRVPDPAGETEIIRKFLEKGLTVVDQQQIAAIRNQEKVLNAVNNPQAAAALGIEFGADVIVIGEAFSEFAERKETLVSCRARIEAKAIQTSTGRILATNGMEAGGADISELIAGKAALRNAGGRLANYFITQLCENVTFDRHQPSVIEISLTNVNFRQVQRFVSSVELLSGVQKTQQQVTGNTARLQVQYAGSAEELATLITENNSSGLQFELTGLSANKINVTVTGEGSHQQQESLSQKELVRLIQTFLTKLGYEPGPADGLMGGKTEAAIKEYQQDANLPVDGKPSMALLQSMKSHIQR